MNVSTFQIRTNANMKIITTMHNEFVDQSFLSSASFLQGSVFTYNTSSIEQDLLKAESYLQSYLIPNFDGEKATILQISLDIRALVEILQNHLKNTREFNAEAGYILNSFLTISNETDQIQILQLCQNQGKYNISSNSCSCPMEFKGSRCSFSSKLAAFISQYTETILKFLTTKNKSQDPQAFNIIADMASLADVIYPSTLQSFVEYLDNFSNNFLSDSSGNTSNSPKKQLLNNRLAHIFIRIYRDLTLILHSSVQAACSRLLQPLFDSAVFALSSSSNKPIFLRANYSYHISIGVVKSSVFPQLSSSSTQQSSSLLRILSQDIGFEFGTGLDILKALFNFPVLSFASDRHFMFIPLQFLKSNQTLHIEILELFDLKTALNPSSEVFTNQNDLIFVTGFVKVRFSQNLRSFSIDNSDQPLTIFLPKQLTFPSLNQTDSSLPAYQCLHYDETKDIFENTSCYFQRENSTHIACSCYTASSFITVIILPDNSASLPTFNDLLLANSFQISNYESTQLSVFKAVHKIKDDDFSTVEADSEILQELLILKNYYGVYAILCFTIGVITLVVFYAYLKDRFLDQKINQNQNPRLACICYFPLIGLLAGQTNYYISSYTRAVTFLSLLASHFAFSSMFLYLLPIDKTTLLCSYYVSFLTIVSSSLLAYSTYGAHHAISINMSGTADSPKNANSKGKLIDGFKFVSGVAFISIFTIAISIAGIIIFVGKLKDSELSAWSQALKYTFFYDAIIDSVIVLLLLIAGQDSFVGNFFALKGFGIEKKKNVNASVNIIARKK